MSNKINKGLTSIIIKKAKAKNKSQSLMEVDYMTNHYLEFSENKEDMIKTLIKDINNSLVKKKIKNNDYLNAVNDNFKGKLFYIALKNGKYFKMDDVEKLVDKKTLIGFINEIETGQEYGWELIDNIHNPKLHDFFYGIFTYLYY